jgi:hypothetical protein
LVKKGDSKPAWLFESVMPGNVFLLGRFDKFLKLFPDPVPIRRTQSQFFDGNCTLGFKKIPDLEDLK